MNEEPTDAPAAAPADSVPRDGLVMALLEVKRLVDELAPDTPGTASATTLAQLLDIPVLQPPLDEAAVARELLHAGSHIRLLRAENRKYKKRVEEMNATIVQLRKGAAAPAPAAAAEEEGVAAEEAAAPDAAA